MKDDPKDATTENRAEDAAEDETPKDDVVEYFGADGEHEGEKYVESGTVRPDLDDQTAAPG